jgi:hypothetical protein
MSEIVGSGSFSRRVFTPCASVCFWKASVRADLEAEPHALRSAALAQHHRMMVEGRGEVGRVLFLGDKIESEDVGVVLDLPVEVGRLIGRVSDLLHADHLAGVFLNHCFTFSAGN